MEKNVSIIIPAYNPNENLKILINVLKKNGFYSIIVINDGSEEKEIFETIKNEVTLIKYEKNMGKGRALKKGMQYFLNNSNNMIGVITVDADGQHAIEDIKKVYQTFKKNNDSLILGCRNFNKPSIPLRSKIGNLLFRKILKAKTKFTISDTQTGLRAIPKKYIKEFCKIDGERFEYETNMLIYCIKNKINIIENEIQSIYIDKNKASNFKAIRDSISIMRLILK